MMGADGDLLALGALACALALPLALGVAALVVMRATRPRGQEDEPARAVLERRLALGEIEPEEFYERESALRSAEPVKPPRRRS